MRLLTRLDLPAKLENLPKFIENILECAKMLGFNDKRLAEIELAAEEALVNIINYAYDNVPGRIWIKCYADDESDRLQINIIDTGKPFNPLKAVSPDLELEASERQVGGLGIFFFKQLMDDVRYHRQEGKNVLLLSVLKPATAGN